MSVYGGNFRNANNIRKAGGADIPPRIEEKKTGGKNIPVQNRGMLAGIFPNGIDRDTLLIAALLLVLIKEGGDLKLILALAYIILEV